MMFFLQMVAAIVVAILIIMLLIACLAWFFVSRWEPQVEELALVPPFRCWLRLVKQVEWCNEEQFRTLDKAVVAEGFEPIGDFEADGFICRAYVDRAKQAYALVQEYEESLIGVEFCRDYEDGARISVSSLPPTLISVAGDAKVVHKPGAEVADLAKILMLEAIAQDLAPVPDGFDALMFARRFDAVYASRMNAVIKRGGPTIGEIRSFAIACGQTCDEDEARDIQLAWRDKICDFISRKQLARYWQLVGERAQRGPIPKDQSDRHLYFAVHDRMDAEILLQVLQEAHEHYDNEAARERVRSFLEDQTPRNAFRSYIAATGKEKALNFVAEVDKPLPGDVWRWQDWKDAFDDELDDFTS